MRSLNALDWICIILVFVGAINWGLVGLFSFNLVSAIFGDQTILARIVYFVVALAGIYLIVASGKLGRKE
ncbi:MAG: DUF378 domain-containing protein [Pseudomonadota bacterium]